MILLLLIFQLSVIKSDMFVLIKLAKLVADEFFDQGDMEKLKLNITPIVRFNTAGPINL